MTWSTRPWAREVCSSIVRRTRCSTSLRLRFSVVSTVRWCLRASRSTRLRVLRASVVALRRALVPRRSVRFSGFAQLGAVGLELFLGAGAAGPRLDQVGDAVADAEDDADGEVDGGLGDGLNLVLLGDRGLGRGAFGRFRRFRRGFFRFRGGAFCLGFGFAAVFGLSHEVESLRISVGCLPRGVRECSEHMFFVRTHVLNPFSASGYASSAARLGAAHDLQRRLAAGGGDRIARIEIELGVRPARGRRRRPNRRPHARSAASPRRRPSGRSAGSASRRSGRQRRRRR